MNRVYTLPRPSHDGISSEVLMSWSINQYLPKVQIPTFDGAALDWVEFITKFYEVVHRQEYLSDTQRNQLLGQHLKGDAKRAVKGFATDSRGYVMSLKQLKYHYGQRPDIARAVLGKVTGGKPVPDHDVKALTDFYFSVSDCLVTLNQLNYVSDLYSSDTLRQAVRRLPSKLQIRWAENSIRIREHSEPSLVHLERWLQARVLALKEARLPQDKKGNPRKDDAVFNGKVGLGNDEKKGGVKKVCPSCEGRHPLHKCEGYTALSPQKRFEMVRKFERCFNCVGEGHMSAKCLSKQTCFEEGCEGKHHTSLHHYFVEKDKKEDEEKVADGGAEAEEAQQVHCTTRKSPRRDVVLLIVPVTLYGLNGKTFDTLALLDNGSQTTLLREDLIEKAGICAKTRDMNLGTVTAKPKKKGSNEVHLHVSARGGGNKMEIEMAFTAKADEFNMPSRPRLEHLRECELYTHLDGVDLAEVDPDDVTILIGSDVPEAQMHLQYQRGAEGQPLAVKTPFGWTLFGTSRRPDRSVQCGQTQAEEDVVNTSLQCLWVEEEEPPTVRINSLARTDEELHDSVETFWKQEQCGILPEKDTTMSQEDISALEIVDSGTQLINNRYEVLMLWKNSTVTLPNNYSLARKRFNFLERRFRANKKTHQGMNKVIQGYLKTNPPKHGR